MISMTELMTTAFYVGSENSSEESSSDGDDDGDDNYSDEESNDEEESGDSESLCSRLGLTTQNIKFLRETNRAVSIAAYDKFLVLLFQLSLRPSTEPLVNDPSSSTLLIYFSNTLGISSNGRQFLLARQYFQS